MDADRAAALALLTADAVRTRARELFAIGAAGHLPHFRIDLGRMPDVVQLVSAVMRDSYPVGAIPFHARWRHFVRNGVDQWDGLAQRQAWPDRTARLRAEFDLAIVSILLDAGAGAAWRYTLADGARVGRSEGLALASFDMFAAGAFSADPGRDPLRVDADALADLTAETLARAFQVSEANPLAGLDGRADLLRRLGQEVRANPDVFGRADRPRPGGLADHLLAQGPGNALAAADVLHALLLHLGPIWPARLSLGGIPLGDCWRHPALAGNPSGDYVPLHKLSQWLAYSLIEPLERAGIEVTEIDGLTGLAEYRNGGLFLDTGVLVLRDPADATRAHPVDASLVVEWRALTVALLDRLAIDVRQALALPPASFPLAKLLEGGTWAAGRRAAFARRPDGSPPLAVISDGTVF